MHRVLQSCVCSTNNNNFFGQLRDSISKDSISKDSISKDSINIINALKPTLQCSSDVLRSPESFTAMQRFVYSVTHILLIVTNSCGLSVDHNDGDYQLSCNCAAVPQPLLRGLSSILRFLHLFI